MPEEKLNQLSDLSHLLSAATNVIVTDLIEIPFFVFSLNGFAVAVDHCILCYDAKLGRINFDNLELNLSHTATAREQIPLFYRPISLTEVWSKEYVEQRACKTFHGIGDRKDGDSLGLGED